LILTSSLNNRLSLQEILHWTWTPCNPEACQATVAKNPFKSRFCEPAASERPSLYRRAESSQSSAFLRREDEILTGAVAIGAHLPQGFVESLAGQKKGDKPLPPTGEFIFFCPG
jgi:hypothetical protein